MNAIRIAIAESYIKIMDGDGKNGGVKTGLENLVLLPISFEIVHVK